MAELAALFFSSLDPSTRKQAEQTLTQASLAQNFGLEVLALALDSTQDRAIRLASGIYFKNTIKRRWSPVSSFVTSTFDKASFCSPLVAGIRWSHLGIWTSPNYRLLISRIRLSIRRLRRANCAFMFRRYQPVGARFQSR